MGPTVDTVGNAGVEARLSAGIGGAEVRAQGTEDATFGLTLESYFSVGYQGLANEDASVGGGGGLAFLWFPDPVFALRVAAFGGGRAHVGVSGGRGSSAPFGFEVDGMLAIGEHMIFGSYLVGLGARVDGVYNRFESRAVFALPISLQIQEGGAYF